MTKPQRYGVSSMPCESGLYVLHNDYLALEAEVKRLRNLLACRPALNSGLIESYSQWTAVVYDSEITRTKEKA